MKVTEKKLKEFESLVALRYQLVHEQDRFVSSEIKAVSAQVQKIFSKVPRTYKWTHKLNIAERQFALQQGRFLQIPTTCKGVYKYLISWFKFRSIQCVALPVLWGNKVIHIFTLNSLNKN